MGFAESQRREESKSQIVSVYHKRIERLQDFQQKMKKEIEFYSQNDVPGKERKLQLVLEISIGKIEQTKNDISQLTGNPYAPRPKIRKQQCCCC